MNEELRICYIVTNKENMNIKKERKIPYIMYRLLRHRKSSMNGDSIDQNA